MAADRKKYLLGYVYNEYKSEIDRKYLIENKALGYYTILGISFAAFITSLIYIVTNNYTLEPTLVGFLNAACIPISIHYIVFMTIIIFLLKRAFRPKGMEHYTVEEFWEKLQEAAEDMVYDSIYKNIHDCLVANRKENDKIVSYIQLVDFLMIHLLIFNIFLTAKIIFSILLEKGNFYA